MFRISYCGIWSVVYYYYSCIALLSVIPADFRTLLITSCCIIIKKIAELHQGILLLHFSPRLSANEVSKDGARKRLLASFLPHGLRLQAAFIRVDLHESCICLLHAPPSHQTNHQITNNHRHHQPLYTLAALHHHRLVRANQRRTCDFATSAHSHCFARTHTDDHNFIVRNEHCIAFTQQQHLEPLHSALVARSHHPQQWVGSRM